MKIIEPSYEILTNIDGNKILKDIELAGRCCYKSEDKITDDSCIEFVQNLLNRGHLAMIEHSFLSVKFICNRGFTHEMVRHRLCAFAQESTRFVNYSKDKHGSEITVIRPPFLHESKRPMPEDWKHDANFLNNELDWLAAMKHAELSYLKLISNGCTPNEARGVLPIDVKTEITVSCNLREWIHIFKMRTPNTAHPSMQQLMRPLCTELKTRIPLIFDELSW